MPRVCYRFEQYLQLNHTTNVINAIIHAKTFTNNNLLWRVEIDSLFPNLEYFNCSSGYFLEYHASSLSDIAKIINRKYQTIAYYGFEKSELVDFVLNEKLSGVDRIVQIGQTTEFSAIWDGFDLIRTLSRCVQVC